METGIAEVYQGRLEFYQSGVADFIPLKPRRRDHRTRDDTIAKITGSRVASTIAAAYHMPTHVYSQSPVDRNIGPAGLLPYKQSQLRSEEGAIWRAIIASGTTRNT